MLLSTRAAQTEGWEKQYQISGRRKRRCIWLASDAREARLCTAADKHPKSSNAIGRQNPNQLSAGTAKNSHSHLAGRIGQMSANEVCWRRNPWIDASVSTTAVTQTRGLD